MAVHIAVSQLIETATKTRRCDLEVCSLNAMGLKKDFAERSAIIGALKDGTLVIEVHMKQTGASTLTAPFVPENPFCQNALEKFLDEESADVVFEVSADHLGGERISCKPDQKRVCRLPARNIGDILPRFLCSHGFQQNKNAWQEV